MTQAAPPGRHLIVTENIPAAILDFRKEYRGLSRCRLYGRNAAGHACRVVHRRAFAFALCRGDHVKWHNFTPTEQERAEAAAQRT